MTTRRWFARPEACSSTFRIMSSASGLFIPAGVGVVVYLGTIRDDAVPIVGALVISWFVGLALVAWLVLGLEKALRR